jgi:hypothetical protein
LKSVKKSLRKVEPGAKQVCVDDVVQDRADVDGDRRRERIRLLKLVRQIGDHGIGAQGRRLGGQRRHHHHVSRVLHELAGVAMIGMVIVGPVREHEVGLIKADEADDGQAVGAARLEQAVVVVEDAVRGADDGGGGPRTLMVPCPPPGPIP